MKACTEDQVNKGEDSRNAYLGFKKFGLSNALICPVFKDEILVGKQGGLKGQAYSIVVDEC
jgi:hypothetical protein